MRDESQFIGIDNNRLLHVREVGKLCYELASRLFYWDESKCRQMFVMGFLHDVGYEFAEEQTEHEKIGGELMFATGYQHAEPIRLHGDPNVSLSDDRLLLLNIADMTVNGEGERVGFDKRLEGIGFRYGKDSEQYEAASAVIRKIRSELKRREIRELPL